MFFCRFNGFLKLYWTCLNTKIFHKFPLELKMATAVLSMKYMKTPEIIGTELICLSHHMDLKITELYLPENTHKPLICLTEILQLTIFLLHPNAGNINNKYVFV